MWQERNEGTIVHTDEKGNLLCVSKSLSQGTLQDNTETFKTKADALADGNQKKHLIAVAHYIIANGPVVKTQDAGKLYMSKKGLETHVVNKRRQKNWKAEEGDGVCGGQWSC